MKTDVFSVFIQLISMKTDVVSVFIQLIIKLDIKKNLIYGSRWEYHLHDNFQFHTSAHTHFIPHGYQGNVLQTGWLKQNIIFDFINGPWLYAMNAGNRNQRNLNRLKKCVSKWEVSLARTSWSCTEIHGFCELKSPVCFLSGVFLT